MDDPALMELYGLRIPVVLVDGVVLVEGIITRHDIDAALRGLA